jgi:WD40 repeat protein
MATSPDGSLIAVAVGTDLGVIGYPDLTVKTVATDIDLPHRMRFSPNGERIVVASYEDTVTLIEARTGAAQVYDTGQDVNDAIVMPDRPDEVAYASDEDEIVVYDMKAGRKVFGSAPLIDDYQSKGWGVFFERDQTALACDPSTLRLIAGGDDNKVWRFDGLRAGAPTFLNPIDFDGNIREILCCSGGSYAVALDSTAVHLMSPTGVIGPSFKPSFGSLPYGPSGGAPVPGGRPFVGSPPLGGIRIALVPDGSVLMASNGRAVRWEPTSRTAVVSLDYSAAQIDAGSSLPADSAFVACDGKKCAVARVVHAPAPAHEVEAVPVGDAEMERISSLLEFSDGTRALAGSHKGNLRFVFFAPGRGLEPPIDPPGLSPGGSFEQGALANGYLEPSGRVFEITSSPRSVTLVGRTATGADGRRLEYDNAGGRWKVKLLDGTQESLSPP